MGGRGGSQLWLLTAVAGAAAEQEAVIGESVARYLTDPSVICMDGSGDDVRRALVIYLRISGGNRSPDSVRVGSEICQMCLHRTAAPS